MKLDFNASFIHIKTNDGKVYDFSINDIEYLKIDNESPQVLEVSENQFLDCNPKNIIEGMVVINGQTYTKSVGGSIGNVVDLGLPSGTLWADHNIGATKPEDMGALIAWGEIGAVEEGYVKGIKMKDGEQNYNFNNYKYSAYDTRKSVKYVVRAECGITDNKLELESIDDAAIFNWGADWKTPTINQLSELFNEKYTILKWSERNGISGMEIISRKNGNSIFLPAYNGVGSYWSCSLERSFRRCAQRYCFDRSHRCNPGYLSYCYGESIRPVCSINKGQ